MTNPFEYLQNLLSSPYYWASCTEPVAIPHYWSLLSPVAVNRVSFPNPDGFSFLLGALET